MKQNIMWIITEKKENEKFHLITEKRFDEVCSICNAPVSVGELVLKQAEQIKEKNKVIKIICLDCHNNAPKIGKYLRPSQESIEAIRKTGLEIDEVKIRKIMYIFKNKEAGKWQ